PRQSTGTALRADWRGKPRPTDSPDFCLFLAYVNAYGGRSPAVALFQLRALVSRTGAASAPLARRQGLRPVTGAPSSTRHH
ncbi:MAG: hypothetical protein M3Y81_29120, partial [Chloroflexota bacterium]|nr:hypothetical protein [Chloroflexota bacterium]